MSTDPLEAIKARITRELDTVAENLLEQVQEEIDSLKSRHENSITDTFEVYEKRNMTLNRQLESLKAQLGQVQELLETERKNATATNTEIIQLRQSLKEKDEIISSMHAKVSSTNSELQGLQAQNKSLKQQTKRLGELEGFAKELREDKTWIKKMDKMWASARKLVESHLREDVPPDKLIDLGTRLETWKEFRDSRILNCLPLPCSNSPAAKQMRITALLAIVTRSIDQHIFHPTYILGEDEDKDDGIRPLLVYLAAENSKKEAYLRALLLSIDPEKEAENASMRVRQVVEEIFPYAQNVLPDAKCKKFKETLEKVVQQALEAWQLARCSREKFEPTFSLYDVAEWGQFSFEESNVTNGEQSTAGGVEGDEDRELIVIFPAVCLIRDNDGSDLAIEGVALMESQSVAAVAEVKKEVEEREKEKGKARRRPSSFTGGKMPTPIRTRPATNLSNGASGTNGASDTNGTTNFLSKTAPSSAQ